MELSLPINPSALALLSDDTDERFRAVRDLGLAEEHLDLLEQIAESDGDPRVGMSAAAWLAINGRTIWLDHLASLMESLIDEELRKMVTSLLFCLERAIRNPA